MSDLETVHVKLGISGTYWEKKPQYRIQCNDKVILEGEVTGASDQVEYLEFDCTYDTPELELKVFLTNKEDTDVLKDDPLSEKYVVISDMLLNIISCEVDEINLGSLIWDQTEFVAEDSTRPTLKSCVNLGWNGAWTLRWSNPFYIWLLEHI